MVFMIHSVSSTKLRKTKYSWRFSQQFAMAAMAVVLGSAWLVRLQLWYSVTHSEVKPFGFVQWFDFCICKQTNNKQNIVKMVYGGCIYLGIY